MVSIILIGAAVNIALDKLNDAINDCDRALEVNNKFVKVRDAGN